MNLTWEPPDVLDEYRIERLLGRGSMGRVYLAQDTLLERPVALKLIAQRRPDEAARRRFLTEARALARLQHPNVVAVHRAGEVQGYPYLVTELVRGKPLSDLPKPLSARRIISIGLDLARGLAAAHRSGVLHRDIKPANAVVADGGDVKLIDFGLAVVAGEPAPIGSRTAAPASDNGRAEIAGTPIYMAPEMLRGEPATVWSDIYALGVVLYELCAGVAPRATLAPDADDETWIAGVADPIEQRAPDIDPRVASIVARCMAPNPEDRFPSADALTDALAVLTVGPALPAPPGNPFRGLASFEAEHRALFFGRAAESRAVVDRLRQAAIAVVTGDSGIGKSSLCRAGVVPLVLDGALGDGRRYRTITVLPGRHPYASLLAAVSTTFPIDEAAIAEEEAQDPAAFVRAFRRALGKEDGALLLVDQAEELVTFADPDEAHAFASIVARLPAATAGVRVLLTVRGDFFTRLATLPGLGEVLERSLFVLRPLSPEGVRTAITGPAAQHGVAFEPPDLVDTLASAAIDTAGGLPLLQFALAELWEARRDAKTITPALIEAIGGVEGALARHAESVIDGLSPDARASAKRLLVSLVTPDATARRRTAAELHVELPADRTALDTLVAGRLVVARDMEGETAYELAHESLLRSWGQLARWLDQTHEQRSLVNEIEQAAALWLRRGKREDETWTGEALAQAARRVERWNIELHADARAFLDEGLRREHRGRRRRRWLIGGTIGALSLVAVASIGAAFAFSEKEKEAIRQQEEIRLAAADMGVFELLLEPFDWDVESQSFVVPSAPPPLQWRLHAVSATDPHEPGRLYGADDLHRGGRRVEANVVHQHVEARSGPAFLEVSERGGQCAPSWVFLQHLPGYTERSTPTPPVLHIAVPTCQASAAGLIEIRAGEFVPHRDAKGDGAAPVALPAFCIDRTEVTRAAFAKYESMEALSGDSAAQTPHLDFNRQGAERLPVVGVTFFTARNYCRFMGKELPSVDQWQKALRGGLSINGEPNPAPKRLTPWISPTSRPLANLDDEADAFDDLAPVGSFPDDTSPYGLMDLAGNASEWSADRAAPTQFRGLRIVLGGNWDSPVALRHHEVTWRNTRPDRAVDFAVGFRCVAPPPTR